MAVVPEEAIAMHRFSSRLSQLPATALLLALLWPGSVIHAQGQSGYISGRVVDQTGNLLPGVRVALINRRTGRISSTVSDGAGVYRIGIDAGLYTVTFELSGFARLEIGNFEVQAGRKYYVDQSLKVGNVTEAVQVTAEHALLVDTRTALRGHNVTAAEIERLPRGRSFQSIALISPSVNSGDIEGGFQVNGASGAENAFAIDGVVTNSVINGSSRQNTVFEHIQEVQVQTTGIPAEFGGALGGVIIAVTKSGGNIFTGEGHYYLDGSPLSAGPVKRLVLSPIDEKTVQYWQDSKQMDVRQEFGGSIGGPIVRNRLFFFASFSPRVNVRTNTYRFANGAEEGDIQRTATLTQAFGKINVRSRRVNAYVSVAFHADRRERHAGRVQRLRCRLPLEFKGRQRRQQGARLGADAGERQRQRRRGHFERRVRDVSRRVLPRSVHRHRHSADDQLHLPDGTCDVISRNPSEPCRSAAHTEHAARTNHQLRHDQAHALQCSTATTPSRVAARIR